MKAGNKILWMILVTALAGIVFGAPSVFAGEGRKAILSVVRGSVQVHVQGERDWKPARAGMILSEKDEIQTAKDGLVEIFLDEGGSVGKLRLSERSRLNLLTMDIDTESGDKVTLLELAVGKVLVEVEKLKGESKFEVKTPTSTAGVQGTVFEVAVELR